VSPEGPYRLELTFSHDTDDGARAVWRPTGRELGGTEPPAQVPSFLVLEAMTQCAGELLRRGHPDRYWMLGGIDGAEFAPVAPHADVILRCNVLRLTARTALVGVFASADRTVSHARLLLVAVAS
jgi:hypothetical protein